MKNFLKTTHSFGVSFAKTEFFFLPKTVMNTTTILCPQCVTVVKYEKLKTLCTSENTQN